MLCVLQSHTDTLVPTHLEPTKWALRKHAYSNILKISPPKTENFQKYSDTFHISAQNIDCGDSLKRPRRMVLTSTHYVLEQK